ncbi:MAG: VOC family protein [Bdellovibrionota bacterium]
MKTAHIHLSLSNLPAAIDWMKSTLDMNPTYQNPGMAVFAFENVTYVFDASDTDSAVTIAIDSDDCEKSTTEVRDRGARILEEPQAQPWGVKTAYFAGPGQITFEFEESLRV